MTTDIPMLRDGTVYEVYIIRKMVIVVKMKLKRLRNYVM